VKFLENPIVKGILTVIGLGLAGTAGVPQLASVSSVLAPIGMFILGSLHVQRPGDVKAEQS
jgi:hypothetical protein